MQFLKSGNGRRSWGFGGLLAASVSLIAAQPAAAQAAEYPCMWSVYKPVKPQHAEAGIANAKRVAANLAQSYRATFTPDVVVDYAKIYNSGRYLNFRHSDSPSTDRMPNKPKSLRLSMGNNFASVDQAVTDGLWPAFHADIVDALAAELGATDYRTITPTCRTKYQPASVHEYRERLHQTLFLLADGTMAFLQYSFSSNYDDKSPKELVKGLKGNIKRKQMFNNNNLSLIALPIFPNLGRFVEFPDKEPNRTQRAAALASVSGQTVDEVKQHYVIDRSLKSGWIMFYHICMKRFGESLPAKNFEMIACLGGPVDQGERKIDPSPTKLATLRRHFKELTTHMRLTWGNEMALVGKIRSEGRIRSKARMAAEDRADRAAERRADAAAIASGIGMGLQSAAGSMAADNRRAANAANARFSAQYGCQAGSCSSGGYGTILTARELEASREASGVNLAGTAPQSKPYSPPAGRQGPTETLQGGAVQDALYRDGQPLKSDAELCSKAVPATVGKVVPGSESPCKCEDRNMGRKVRSCSITFDYVVGKNADREPVGSER